MQGLLIFSMFWYTHEISCHHLYWVEDTSLCQGSLTAWCMWAVRLCQTEASLNGPLSHRNFSCEDLVWTIVAFLFYYWDYYWCPQKLTVHNAMKLRLFQLIRDHKGWSKEHAIPGCHPSLLSTYDQWRSFQKGGECLVMVSTWALCFHGFSDLLPILNHNKGNTRKVWFLVEAAEKHLN